MDNNEFNAIWQGRIDAEDGDQGLRVHQVIRPFSEFEDESGFTIIGFASDLGVQHNQGRTGAKHGPTAARKALANMAWHVDSKLFDAGDITPNEAAGDDPLALAQLDYANCAAAVLSEKQFLIGIGGGHEIGWASYQACRKFIDAENSAMDRIGIINFDAHFDLRKPAPGAAWAGSSGTPFYQVSKDCAERNLPFDYACIGISESANTHALFQYANDNKVQYLLDTQCNSDASAELLEGFLEPLDCLYLTICLDALPASVAPGVSAPAALGISFEFLITTIQQIKALCNMHQVRWLMADIAELNPEYDVDNRTAKVTARLVYEIMKALKS